MGAIAKGRWGWERCPEPHALRRPSTQQVAKVATNPGRQEERCRVDDSGDVQSSQFGHAARPVGRQNTRAGLPDESFQRQHDQVDVIHLTEEWDVIRDEVEWQDEVDESDPDERLVQHRYAPVSQEPAEQPRVVRELLDDLRHLPLRPATRGRLLLTKGSSGAGRPSAETAVEIGEGRRTHAGRSPLEPGGGLVGDGVAGGVVAPVAPPAEGAGAVAS